jgi:hypothetical protein
MPERSASFRRSRFSASVRLLQAAALLTRATSRVSDLATGFAMHAIDRGDRGELTAAIYSAGRGAGREGLFPWEHAWLTRELPPPPARVLLGGAGRGREARWLIDHGYSVIAFDPARDSVARHIAACPQAPCLVLDYESLAYAVRASREGSVDDPNAARVLETSPYDAALLGWGSLTHVLDERDQDALFEALAVLVPSGPILASFFMGSAPPGRGRASQLGAWLGRAVGASSEQSDDAHVRCLTHAGFAYSFEHARLEQLARLAARTLQLHTTGSYPHATFRKP